jgi:hypothetical protein
MVGVVALLVGLYLELDQELQVKEMLVVDQHLQQVEQILQVAEAVRVLWA